MAFVCEHRGEIVGEARYAAVPDTNSCDFGIVIADTWHKTGIAGLLMDALIRHARAQGFDTMESIVLRENRSMLKFVQALGFELIAMPQEGTLVQALKNLRPGAGATAAAH
jgi:RimJ/RimL family protein N-acetyltransferase